MKADPVVVPFAGIPLYKGYVDLDNEAKQHHQHQNFNLTAGNDGYISADTHILENPKLVSVKQQVLYHVKRYLYDIIQLDQSIEPYFLNSWTMVHTSGHHAPRHKHRNSMVSGVLYIHCDEQSGAIVFDKGDINNALTDSFHYPFSERNVFNSGVWKILPLPGDVVLFPSQTFHSVEPSNSDKERVCIAFNVYLRGNLSHDNISEFILG